MMMELMAGEITLKSYLSLRKYVEFTLENNNMVVD